MTIELQHPFTTHWLHHWRNGGTGITRLLGEDKLGLYVSLAESVRLFNDPEIWMTKDGRELHSTKSNLSDFWKFHRERNHQQKMKQVAMDLKLKAQADLARVTTEKDENKRQHEELQLITATAQRELETARAACAVKDQALDKIGFFCAGNSGLLADTCTSISEHCLKALKPDSAAPLLRELAELREDRAFVDWLEANPDKIQNCTWVNLNLGRLFTFNHNINLGDCANTLRGAFRAEMAKGATT